LLRLQHHKIPLGWNNGVFVVRPNANKDCGLFNISLQPYATCCSRKPWQYIYILYSFIENTYCSL